MTRARIFPPHLPFKDITNAMKRLYPTGKIDTIATISLSGNHDVRIVTYDRDMLEELVFEYARWWQLMAIFPQSRIVAPQPVFAVLRAHNSLGMQAYHEDVARYLGLGGIRFRFWPGPEDIVGALNTTVAYRDVFREPTNPWLPMTRIVELQFNTENVVPFRV
jgi:hypothetical protein